MWNSEQHEKETKLKFSEALDIYSNYKKMNEGTSKMTSEEIAGVRAAWKAGKFDEAVKPALEEAIKGYSAYKESQGLDGKVSFREARILERKLKEDEALAAENTENKPAEGEQKVQESGKVSIMGKVREARNLAYKAKKLLREGDMAGATDATQDAMDATADATQAVDAAQGQVPQNVVDSVQAVKASVDQLAQQCGIQPAVDPTADPNAGVPAVDGVADPNAAGAAPAVAPAPMTESTKKASNLSEIRARLAQREAQIKAVKEGVKPEFANPLGDIGRQGEVVEKRRVNLNNDPSTLPEPSIQSLVNGTEKGAIKWPTSKISVKESYAEQMVDKKLQESEENWDFSKILASGVLG